MPHERALLVGIGGGSGSGKSALAKRLRERVGADAVTVLEIDSYYRDYSQLPPRERDKLNYDHPDSIDWKTLLEAVKALRDGETIEQPLYDFSVHGRRDDVMEIEPTPVIVVEGIHCLTHEPLRALFDIKIFVDTDPDIRFIRRLRRDILDRDRSIDGVVNQYLETVRPMYIEFVEPSRRHADIIVPEATAQNTLGVELIVEALAARIERKLEPQD